MSQRINPLFLVSIPRTSHQQLFFAGLIWMAVTALVASPQTSLAVQRQEKVNHQNVPHAGGAAVTAANPTVCGGPFDCPNNDGVIGIAHIGGKSGVFGFGDGGANGMAGISTDAAGVYARTFNGVDGVYGQSDRADGHGVFGYTGGADGVGVLGRSDGTNPRGAWGVFGFSTNGFAGVFGSSGNNGVFGLTGNTTADNAAGVFGKNDGIGIGVLGQNRSTTASAVLGRNDGGGDGVAGFSTGGRGAGVYGFTDSNTGVGGHFANFAGGVALRIDGLTKTDALEIVSGADLAEQFEVNTVLNADRDVVQMQAQPGMVVSIDPDHPGKLVISNQAYDRRVAGIISGAGGVKSGMLLKQSGSVADGAHPVALTGRVYCWADATNGPIEPGDLLTSSGHAGYAMKVTDYAKAQGTTIGKAMSGLAEGQGLVLVLVTLQ